MMEKEFRAFLEGRKLAAEKIEFAISAIKDFEDYLKKSNVELTEADLSLLNGYISLLISEGRNSEDRLVAIARYCYFVKKNDFYRYIAGIINAVEVLPGIGARLAELEGEDVRLRIFEGIDLPPLGSSQESYPRLTRTVMNRMEEVLPHERCKEILTWNYHNIPREAFLGHRERFEKADSLDEYLKDEHGRFVEEITRFMNEGKVWYEQEITPEVVEFVEGNQEVSIGRRIGDRIYVTKMPCEPKKFLEEKDDRMRRYYACHCPLARTAIRDSEPDISATFCYCSAGFTKLAYDVIFGESVEIEMLESALKGDMRCRFAIKIPEGKMK
jgi:predicted hydrocarbon binding protein